MKRMYANEELVKLIQENAPEVEVDDALSGTSENPVQNKVIYNALGNISEHKLHYMKVITSDFTGMITFKTDYNDAFTLDTLKEYLTLKEYTSGSSYLACSGTILNFFTDGQFYLVLIKGIYYNNSQQLRVKIDKQTRSITISDNAISITAGSWSNDTYSLLQNLTDNVSD